MDFKTAVNDLNSTVILLILIAVEGKGAKQKIFKFHCDSINMQQSR